MSEQLPPEAGADIDVLTFGEPMVLLIAEQSGALEQVERFHKSVAGADLNVATGLARLGLRTEYVCALGADSFGAYIRAHLAREGIGQRWVHTHPRRATGMMLKSCVDDGSDPAIEYHRQGSAASALGLGSFSPEWLRQGRFPARHLHLTGISMAVSPSMRQLAFELAALARKNGASISFDPNLRPQLWPSQSEMIATLNAMAALSDIVLPGDGEGRILTGSADPAAIAAYYLARGADQVVVKTGSRGAYCAERLEDGTVQSAQVPAVRVERVVDTVGAGDGFAVGVISARLQGMNLEAAALRGNRIAAQVIQSKGDSTGLPDRATLARLEAG